LLHRLGDELRVMLRTNMARHAAQSELIGRCGLLRP
jgi:hypothetical protein